VFDWGACSATCLSPDGSVPQKERSRKCRCTVDGDEVMPEEGDCEGETSETTDCTITDIPECPVKQCALAGWCEWGSCSAECASKNEPLPVKERTRKCRCTLDGDDVEPEEGDCGDDALSEEETCNDLPICPDEGCTWGAWCPFSSCSGECNGIRTRTRKCGCEDEPDNMSNPERCGNPEDFEERESCGDEDCDCSGPNGKCKENCEGEDCDDDCDCEKEDCPEKCDCDKNVTPSNVVATTSVEVEETTAPEVEETTVPKEVTPIATTPKVPDCVGTDCDDDCDCDKVDCNDCEDCDEHTTPAKHEATTPAKIEATTPAKVEETTEIEDVTEGPVATTPNETKCNCDDENCPKECDCPEKTTIAQQITEAPVVTTIAATTLPTKCDCNDVNCPKECDCDKNTTPEVEPTTAPEDGSGSGETTPAKLVCNCEDKNCPKECNCPEKLEATTINPRFTTPNSCWSEWEPWTNCPEPDVECPCGGCGTSSRDRKCLCGATPECPGCKGTPAHEDKDCTSEQFECEMTNWSDWSGCENTCGADSEETRTRKCNCPEGALETCQNGCEQPFVESRKCGDRTPPCCHYTTW
jgi:hypothetical protein